MVLFCMVVLIDFSPFCFRKTWGFNDQCGKRSPLDIFHFKGSTNIHVPCSLLCLRTQSVPNLKSIVASCLTILVKPTAYLAKWLRGAFNQVKTYFRKNIVHPTSNQQNIYCTHAFNKCAIGNGHCLLRAILRSIKDQIIKPLASCVDDHPESNGLVGASGVS